MCIKIYDIKTIIHSTRRSQEINIYDILLSWKNSSFPFWQSKNHYFARNNLATGLETLETKERTNQRKKERKRNRSINIYHDSLLFIEILNTEPIAILSQGIN